MVPHLKPIKSVLDAIAAPLVPDGEHAYVVSFAHIGGKVNEWFVRTE